MADVFSAHHKHLFLLDLDPKTKARYWEVVNTYRKWLSNRRPDAITAQEFLAYLRSNGYRPRSVLLLPRTRNAINLQFYFYRFYNYFKTAGLFL
jgi:hypothetical protein